MGFRECLMSQAEMMQINSRECDFLSYNIVCSFVYFEPNLTLDVSAEKKKFELFIKIIQKNGLDMASYISIKILVMRIHIIILLCSLLEFSSRSQLILKMVIKYMP